MLYLGRQRWDFQSCSRALKLYTQFLRDCSWQARTPSACVEIIVSFVSDLYFKNSDLNLIFILETIYYFCNILSSEIARNVRFIFEHPLSKYCQGQGKNHIWSFSYLNIFPFLFFFFLYGG